MVEGNGLNQSTSPRRSVVKLSSLAEYPKMVYKRSFIQEGLPRSNTQDKAGCVALLPEISRTGYEGGWDRNRFRNHC